MPARFAVPFPSRPRPLPSFVPAVTSLRLPLFLLSLWTMSEERTAKLKLKRKKCVTTGQGAQEAEKRLQLLPAVGIRQSSAGSWFDEIDLTTAEQLWKQVLTCVSTDLRSVGWGSVPGLPDFTRQVSEQGWGKTEVFEIGQRRFEWFPFPTALSPTVTEQPCTTGLEYETSRTNEQMAEPIDHQPLNAVTPLDISSLVPDSKENDQVCNKNSTQDQKESQSGATKNMKEPTVFQKSSAECVKAPLTSSKSSTKSIKLPQTSQKALDVYLEEAQTSQKRSKKGLQKKILNKGSAKSAGEPQTLPKQTYHLWPTVTMPKNSKVKEETKAAEPPSQRASKCNDDVMDIGEEPVSSNQGRLQDSADKETEAAGSLENCPICLMQFPKQFSQLDMDSHLAQCLSETTVDVVW